MTRGRRAGAPGNRPDMPTIAMSSTQAPVRATGVLGATTGVATATGCATEAAATRTPRPARFAASCLIVGWLNRMVGFNLISKREIGRAHV